MKGYNLPVKRNKKNDAYCILYNKYFSFGFQPMLYISKLYPHIYATAYTVLMLLLFCFKRMICQSEKPALRTSLSKRRDSCAPST